MLRYHHISIFLALLALMGLIVATAIPTSSTAATPTPDPTHAIATPLPRTYSQTAINELKVVIKDTYGIGFASEEEWQAASASEIMWFTDGLHNILEALNITAYYLHLYGEPPEQVDPVTFFR